MALDGSLGSVLDARKWVNVGQPTESDSSDSVVLRREIEHRLRAVGPPYEQVAIALELVVEVLHACAHVGEAGCRLGRPEGVVVIEANRREVAPPGKGISELDMDVCGVGPQVQSRLANAVHACQVLSVPSDPSGEAEAEDEPAETG